MAREFSRRVYFTVSERIPRSGGACGGRSAYTSRGEANVFTRSSESRRVVKFPYRPNAAFRWAVLGAFEVGIATLRRVWRW